MIRALDASNLFPVPAGELSIVFLAAPEMTALHHRFMQHPTPTDVITFDGDPDHDQAGEICVCPDVARDYARSHGGDFSSELTLYVAHGFLHLAGFDDTTPALRRRMRAAEREALEVLRAAAAVPRFAWSRRCFESG
jgi:probable rRNA maturation factor